MRIAARELPRRRERGREIGGAIKTQVEQKDLTPSANAALLEFAFLLNIHGAAPAC